MENKPTTTKKTKPQFPLPPKKKRNTGWKKWVKIIWVGLLAIVLGISALFFAVSQGFLGDMPDVKELENPDIYVASEIYSCLENSKKKKHSRLRTRSSRLI